MLDDEPVVTRIDYGDNWKEEGEPQRDYAACVEEARQVMREILAEVDRFDSGIFD